MREGKYIAKATYMGFASSSELLLIQDDRLTVRVPVSMNIIYIVGGIVVIALILMILRLRER